MYTHHLDSSVTILPCMFLHPTHTRTRACARTHAHTVLNYLRNGRRHESSPKTLWLISPKTKAILRYSHNAVIKLRKFNTDKILYNIQFIFRFLQLSQILP